MTASDTNQPLRRLKLLMRSGNSVMADGVIEAEWVVRHGQVITLRLKQQRSPRHAYVHVDTLDLSQIEAIVELPAESREAFRSKA